MCDTGNCAQYPVTNLMEKNIKNDAFARVTESRCHRPEAGTTL